MITVWALWSSRVDTYSAHELVEVFADRETAETVRDNLFGRRRSRMLRTDVWEDDEDFPDLYVRPLTAR